MTITSLKNKVIATFEARTFPEFDSSFQQLCKAAGGGIFNNYFKTPGEKTEYTVEFYYPSTKAANSGVARLYDLEDKIPTLKVTFSLKAE
jgi:hypothetical protein